MTRNTRFYLGFRVIDGVVDREVFTAESVPTLKSHGHIYRAAIGPFRTLRSAEEWSSINRKGHTLGD